MPQHDRVELAERGAELAGRGAELAQFDEAIELGRWVRADYIRRELAGRQDAVVVFARSIAVLGEQATAELAARLSGLDPATADRAACSLEGLSLLRRHGSRLALDPLAVDVALSLAPQQPSAPDLHRRAAELLRHVDVGDTDAAHGVARDDRAGRSPAVTSTNDAINGAALRAGRPPPGSGPAAPPRAGSPTARITDDAISVYSHAVVNPEGSLSDMCTGTGIDPRRLDAAVRLLRSLRLLRNSSYVECGFEPVSPETAVAELFADEQEEINRRQAEILRMRGQVLSLLPAYFDALRSSRSSKSVEVVRDVTEVRHLLACFARRAVHEVCTAHPGKGFSAQSLTRSLSIDIPLLARGQGLRSLLQHSTRYHLPARQYVAQVTAHGAQVRTVPAVPRRLILFDREVLFVPVEGDSGEGAAVVRDPAVIDYVRAGFEQMWMSARPFVPDEASPAEDHDGSRSEVRQSIIGQLAAGAKDDVIARRLGLSVRTCRRHIAAIMDSLGASSRFQAGVLAAQRRMLSLG